MFAIVTVLALVLVSQLSPAGSQDERAAGRSNGAGFFEVGLWPEEGRPRLVTGTTILSPRTEPREDAPAGPVLHVRKGQLVEFKETVYRTTVPGRMKALQDSQVTGRRFGSIVRLSRDDYYSERFPTTSTPVRAGEIIDYLQYRAEGGCFLRIRGDVVEADHCPHFLADPPHPFVLLAEPDTEWWVQMVLEGRPVGWLLVDGRKVREQDRTF